MLATISGEIKLQLSGYFWIRAQISSNAIRCLYPITTKDNFSPEPYKNGRFMVIIKFVANHFPLNDSHLSPYKLLAETKLISICLRRRENEVTGKKSYGEADGWMGILQSY